MQYSDTSTLQGLVQDIYYLSKTNSSFITADDIQRIVNKYYGQLQEAIRAINENFYMAVATTDLVIGNGSYAYPDGVLGDAPPFEKILALYAAYLPADTAAPLPTEFIRCDIVDPVSISDPSYEFGGQAPKVLHFGSYFVLLPLVTDTTMYPVTGGIKLYYIGDVPALVNPTDTPKIFPSFHDAIVQGSLIDVAQRKGDLDLRDKSTVTFAKRIAEIKSYASSSIAPELGVVEGQDNIGGWCFPWGQQAMS